MRNILVLLALIFGVASQASVRIVNRPRGLSTGDYKFIDNNGGKIAYRIFGSGAPLFVLNGGPGRSSDTFTHLAEVLSSRTHRQVIIFDQRGTGRSPLPVLILDQP